MSSDSTITDDDQGKTVVTADGKKVGVVSDVRDGTAYVDPDPDLTDQVMSKLGWNDADAQEDVVLPEDVVGTITDDEIRLTG